MITARVYGTFHRDVYSRLEVWMHEHPGIYFDKLKGQSWLNGDLFFSTICFNHEEDKLACMLMFPEIIR